MRAVLACLAATLPAATLLAGAAPVPEPSPARRVFVERNVARGARTAVLMLEPDGRFASLTSTTRSAGPDRGRLDTDKGYWLHCGSWRSAGPDTLVVHAQLVESFRYFPPPQPGAWQRMAFRMARHGGTRSLTLGGRAYGEVAAPPIKPAMTAGLHRFCAGARAREPRWN